MDAEMSRGLLPGLLSLGAKFVPTVQRVAERTLESARAFASDAAHHDFSHKKHDGREERAAAEVELARAPAAGSLGDDVAVGLRRRAAADGGAVAYAS